MSDRHDMFVGTVPGTPWLGVWHNVDVPTMSNYALLVDGAGRAWVDGVMCGWYCHGGNA